jgi:hypothetical protein
MAAEGFDPKDLAAIVERHILEGVERGQRLMR